MKTIGFLSFGHWTPSPQSATRSAADATFADNPHVIEAILTHVAPALGWR